MERKNPLQALISFLGLKRSIVGMLAMVVLVGLGERMAERFLPIYLQALGGGAIVVGALNAMENLLSALYSFPGGALSDRLGTRKALFVFNGIAMFGFLIVILFPSWQAVLFGAVFFIAWDAMSLPATMGLLASVLPQGKRTMGVSVQALVRRIPMILGPLIGGSLIAAFGTKTGVRLAFVISLAMAVLALFLQQALIRDEGARNRSFEKNPLKLFCEMGADLRNLLASDILIRFCEQIPYAFVVIWCMTRIAHPVTAFQFGLLTAVEYITATAVYVPVAYFADRMGQRPFVALTFVFFTLFPLALFFAGSFETLLPVFVLRGLKEFGEPSRKALIMELSPEGKKAAMFGLYYLIRDSIVSVAAFGGAFLWMIAPAVNFAVAAAFGVIGTLWFVLRGRDIPMIKG